MRAKSGGGITSNKLKSVGVKAGPSNTNVVSPRGVSQLGYATGSQLKGAESYGTKNTALSVFERKAAEQPLGNAVATNVGAGGPGTGRTTYPSGYQSLHGKPVQGSTPAPRDTLASYGPERRRG